MNSITPRTVYVNVYHILLKLGGNTNVGPFPHIPLLFRHISQYIKKELRIKALTNLSHSF